MARFFKDRTNTKGMAPGSLVFIGKQKEEKTLISLMDYDAEQLTEERNVELPELLNLKQTPTVSWINLYGIHDSELIRKLGEQFNTQVLFLEDILNTDQRPRFYDGTDNLGFILKNISYNAETRKVMVDQVSLLLGPNYLISFQERKANFFDPVRVRIRNAKGRIRTSGTDYLAYVLIDTIIDDYLGAIASIGEKIEEIGRKVITNPSHETSAELYHFKIEMSYLRKNIRPVKEMIIMWQKSESSLLNKKTRTFLQELNDLVMQAEESIEIYNNLLADGLNIYNTNISNKANEIMKVLTIFAAVFIPLTFLAGIYGMNFDYIPELHFRYSYPIFWGVVLSVGIGLFFFFRKRKWL